MQQGACAAYWPTFWGFDSIPLLRESHLFVRARTQTHTHTPKQEHRVPPLFSLWPSLPNVAFQWNLNRIRSFLYTSISTCGDTAEGNIEYSCFIQPSLNQAMPRLTPVLEENKRAPTHTQQSHLPCQSHIPDFRTRGESKKFMVSNRKQERKGQELTIPPASCVCCGFYILLLDERRLYQTGSHRNPAPNPVRFLLCLHCETLSPFSVKVTGGGDCGECTESVKASHKQTTQSWTSL